MTKMLQRKFVTTAMTAVTVLLLVLLGAINALNYGMNVEQTNRTLRMLSENGGAFPKEENPPKQGRPDFLNPPMDADAAMSTRYFIVFLDENGNIAGADMTRIASVTDEEAKVMAEEILKEEKASGKTGRFHYRLTERMDGRGSFLIFLDTSNQLRSTLGVLLISVFIGILCWLLMLLFVMVLAKRAIRPIAENIEKQKQFITNAGHEIKTPLAIIMANTDAMELHTGENKWSRNIRSQTIRLNGLMQNLLTLAKTEEMGEEKVRLPLEDFSLSLLLEEMLHPYYEAALLRDISIQEDIQKEVSIRANKENITQLLSILFDNAVKYTNEGGSIEVFLKRNGKEICMQVKNTCGKLPEAEPEKLFERFYRGDAARTQKSGGYGIGLSAARAIAKAHQGTLTASYEENNRICFTLQLKLKNM